MDSKKANVLFVDDDEAFTRCLTRSVSQHTCGCKCHSASNEAEALRLAGSLSSPDISHLAALIEDAIDVARLARLSKKRNIDALFAVASLGLMTRSDKMKPVIDQIGFAASNLQPVLLCGETGVGKGVFEPVFELSHEKADFPCGNGSRFGELSFSYLSVDSASRQAREALDLFEA